MPYVQPLPWTEFVACPICTHNFGFYRRHPISLGCGHSVCRLCLASLYNQQCPFDQSPITMDHKNLPVNSALLRLASLRNGGNCAISEILSALPPPCVRELKKDDLKCFFVSKACIEHMAMHLHKAINNAENPLSRSMQRKLVTLINCQLMTEEGRMRAMRVSRCIGERAVIEMIMRQQKPIQLNSCLWAAVRGRGCQFLGPVLQEELLRHLLAALAGGVALSRKSLVMQVVQSLKSEYSQASKTSVGHVVQLLYRASCFNVSKRECESSLMQLKEEFSTYDSLRQEHDSQIVQIAMEAGLRIPPEQWSTLLYGDLIHKSYMQSIIDRLQTPESFKQSIQELVLTLQRNGDMGEFESMRPHLQDLANIEISTDKPTTWPDIGKTLNAIRNVVDGFVDFEIRVRKQSERRLNQRNSNGVNIFGHNKSEMESYRTENFRNPMVDGDQGFHSNRPMMRSTLSSPSFHGGPGLQQSNISNIRHGSNAAASIFIQKRFEKKQTQGVQNFKVHRPAQLSTPTKSYKNPLVIQSMSNINAIQKSTQTNKNIAAPPPGFEQLQLLRLNGKRSSCSTSLYSSSNSMKSSTTENSKKLSTRTPLLQSNWSQRRNESERQHLLSTIQNAQLRLPKVTQSPSVGNIIKNKSSLSLKERLSQATVKSSNQNSGAPSSSPSCDVNTDTEAKDRRQIQELQQRFNQAFRISTPKPNDTSSTTDSGVNSPSQSNADGIDTELFDENSPDKNEESNIKQALQYRNLNLYQTPNAENSIFLNSDRGFFDRSTEMKSSEFPNSGQFLNCGRNSDVKPENPRSNFPGNFAMDFPKSSQLKLKVPNISTELLREIWEVPPNQPEAKTIKEIWKPLTPPKQDQADFQSNLQDIWERQTQNQNHQHNQHEALNLNPSTHTQHTQTQSCSDTQSNSLSSENGVNNSYMDWMFRHNYTCMEAAYLKIAERYPNVGMGPWTDSNNFGNGSSSGNPSNTVPSCTVTGVRAVSRSSEPSNLGLSALRVLGTMGEQYNPKENEPTIGIPQNQPRKSPLDAAIDTYWKDAMETSLGLNPFLPSVNAADSSYPIPEDMSISQAVRTVLDWRDEYKIQSKENATAATRQASP